MAFMEYDDLDIILELKYYRIREQSFSRENYWETLRN